MATMRAELQRRASRWATMWPVETGECHDRQIALLVAALSGAGALLLEIVPAYASGKMTRAQAEYQDTPSGIYSCGMCSLFEAPNGCKVVEGEVGKDGWCKAFALQD